MATMEMTSPVVPKHIQKLLNELEPGDLVQFPRTGFFHWGVYVGYKNVVHLTVIEKEPRPSSAPSASRSLTLSSIPSASSSQSGSSGPSGEVKVSKLSEVAGNRTAKKYNRYDEKYRPLSPNEIMKRAYENVGPRDYDLFKSNCEHFANWCRYDKWISKQSPFRSSNRAPVSSENLQIAQ